MHELSVVFVLSLDGKKKTITRYGRSKSHAYITKSTETDYGVVLCAVFGLLVCESCATRYNIIARFLLFALSVALALEKLSQMSCIVYIRI